MSHLLLLAALLLGAADALVGPLVVGLNKYSHDASICVADARTGEPLLVWAKERLTRRKHDGGDTAALVDAALDALGAAPADVALVVSNNHHHRVAPFEQALGGATAAGGAGALSLIHISEPTRPY